MRRAMKSWMAAGEWGSARLPPHETVAVDVDQVVPAHAPMAPRGSIDDPLDDRDRLQPFLEPPRGRGAGPPRAVDGDQRTHEPAVTRRAQAVDARDDARLALELRRPRLG